MDPRSREPNSDIGLLIHNDAFAARAMKTINADFDPANSYWLSLDERGNLLWTATSAPGPVERLRLGGVNG